MRCCFLAGVLILVLPPTIATAAPCVYVSTFTGHQILCVDSDSGATSVILTDKSISPEDIVVGPDRKIYIPDSQPTKRTSVVWQFDPTVPQGHDNPREVAFFPAGTLVQGPSFDGSDDLYLNTRGPRAAGAWRVPGAANANATLPINPENIVPSFSRSGAGTTFTVDGRLLLVDAAGKRVVVSTPPFTSIENEPLSQGFTNPIGIAVNTCGDILVADGNAVDRLSSNGVFKNHYVEFPAHDVAQYLEVDASNTVFVVTAVNAFGAGGKVWKVTPSDSGDPILSCFDDPANPTSTGEATLLVSLKDALHHVPGLASDRALGLALPPSNVSITQTFDVNHLQNTYNFGQHTFTLRFQNVFQSFPLTITALKSQPGDVQFRPGTFQPGTVATRYNSEGGFVIQYKIENPPDANAYEHNDIRVKPAFFANQVSDTPGVARSDGDQDPYENDVSLYFWPTIIPGTDTGQMGTIDDFSSYVSFHSPLDPAKTAAKFELKSPSIAFGIPSFTRGAAIPVAFRATDNEGQPIPGIVARLSIATVNPSIGEEVVSKDNQNVRNLFNGGETGNLYTYMVDSANFSPGLHGFTITSDSFGPQSFMVRIVEPNE